MGEWIVGSSVQTAILCYPAGPFALWYGQDDPRVRAVARWVWTIGCLAFLVHVVSSFHVFYRWDHGVAIAETARQTSETTGFDSGVGLYFNYAFTALWAFDAFTWWKNPSGHAARRRSLVIALHGFMFFMLFNGAVVFADGISRILGWIVTVVLIAGFGNYLRAGRGQP